MPEPTFVDFYEVLQLSPNATSDTVERVYRMLAKRFHPDNQETGDAQRFADVQRAFDTISDPSARAAFDVKYDENRALTWKVFRQEGASDHRSEDRRLFHAILSLLYIARRRDPLNGGLGSVTMEKLLGCPSQHLEFPVWYLKQRGWDRTARERALRHHGRWRGQDRERRPGAPGQSTAGQPVRDPPLLDGGAGRPVARRDHDAPELRRPAARRSRGRLPAALRRRVGRCERLQLAAGPPGQRLGRHLSLPIGAKEHLQLLPE